MNKTLFRKSRTKISKIIVNDPHIPYCVKMRLLRIFSGEKGQYFFMRDDFL